MQNWHVPLSFVTEPGMMWGVGLLSTERVRSGNKGGGGGVSWEVRCIRHEWGEDFGEGAVDEVKV